MRGARVFVMVAVSVALAGCGGAPAPTSAPTPTVTYWARAMPHASVRPALPDVPPPTIVVTAVADAFAVYPRAGRGAPEGLLARNDWGQPIALPVIGIAKDGGERWLHVRLPIRPNGSTGWVRAADVRARRVHERITVDLSEHRLTLLHDGDPVRSILVGVGADTYPTTPGSFFVWARLAYDPPGVYGVGALGLSGFSEVITDWAGGGRMAIHGTSDPTNRGRDVSHGCVRVFNPQMAQLAGVLMGTPVLITR